MPSPGYLCLLLVAAFATAWLGLRLLLPRLRARLILDVPNERSSHSAPTPRGGGIALIGAALLWMGVSHMPGSVLLGALVLALVSWRDDTKGLTPGARLIWQFLLVVLAWPALYRYGAPAHLSPWLALPVLVVIWMGFTNLYNFMDGIDGITSVETISIGAGLLVVHIASPGVPEGLVTYGLILAGAAAAFLRFNWPPAKLFLGDVGSIPLGFLTGWLLLTLAMSGYAAAALILPAYYLADSGVTLFRRWRRGAKLTQAHAEHYYQQAVQGGRTHAEVSLRIARLNIALILLAACSTFGTLFAVSGVLIAYALAFAQLKEFREPLTPRGDYAL
jgi:UDP-N-acetylmuramyl pentapeptide phosphotransferase/UDP-N-acetylglucosamine-1-phosphate transferase